MTLTLDHPTCVALPLFYAFSGCDTVSSFILKENARDGMSGCKTIPTLMRYSFVLGIDQVIWQKQTWIPLKVSLWRCTQNGVKYHWQVYELMFKSLTDNNLQTLPPRRRALEQHTRRVCYQAGCVWQEPVGDLTFPNPENWGWVFEGNMYQPQWQQEKCPITIKNLTLTCSCHKGTCHKSGLACISMCSCNHKCLW